MYNEEHQSSAKPSGIRPPSRLQMPSVRGLADISESDANARSTMLPTANGGYKRQAGPDRTKSAPAEPLSTTNADPVNMHQPKRKTLAERAGEPPTSYQVAPSGSLPVSAPVKGTTLAGVRQKISHGFSKSVSSSAHVPKAVLARPPSSSGRPQTSMAHQRSGMATSVGGRPATAMDGALEQTRQGPGRAPILSPMPSPYSFHESLCRSRPRRPGLSDVTFQTPTRSTPSVATADGTKTTSRRAARNVSITTQMRALTLEDRSSSSNETSAVQPQDTGPLHEKMSTRNARASTEKSGPSSPSKLPKIKPCPLPVPAQSSASVLAPKTPSRRTDAAKVEFSTPITSFLSKDSNTRTAFDTDSRLGKVEEWYKTLQSQMENANKDRCNMQDNLSLFKDQRMSPSEPRFALQSLLSEIILKDASPKTLKVTHGLITTVNRLEQIRTEKTEENEELCAEVELLKQRLTTAQVDLDAAHRTHTFDMDDEKRRHRNEVEDLRDDMRRDIENLRRELQTEQDRLVRNHRADLDDQERQFKAKLEDERSLRLREVQEVSTQLDLVKQQAELENGTRDRDAQTVRDSLARKEGEVIQKDILIDSLKVSLTAEADASRRKLAEQEELFKKMLSDATSRISSLEMERDAVKAKVSFLESDSQAQSRAFADIRREADDALQSKKLAEEKSQYYLDKLRTEETRRRKLFNQVQELKGNIRVFARVRPHLGAAEDAIASLDYPDAAEEAKEIAIMGPEQVSALGKVSQSRNMFAFDRVFNTGAQNAEIFDEISQLVQSALDGYNVCIFAYGQTGSGKTHTMSSSNDGMIPLAVHQIFESAAELEEKGWTYTLEGSFVEVYNENLNDLLGRAEDLDKKKLNIVHDTVRGSTTITDVEKVTLDSPERVSTLLAHAAKNRSVAATKANERSSRSHSVFILSLTGINDQTGESCHGTLNLVDLAGSERLAHSQAEGARLKETQNINRSLSCLGDVIAALGSKGDGGHVPYRNSKLTYLLQNALGGNSKTLMMVMVSPMKEHLGETLGSLRFATKVASTHIGTAKKSVKVRGE